MNHDCRSFRRELERALEGRRAAELDGLGWHEHLLGCRECRALLEAEEALETLLDSLPEPQLPPSLARRVLRRLREAERGREAALDRLLELDESAQAPRGLAQRVLHGLAAERGRSARTAEERLDELLERAREVHVPAGLAGRVLSGVAEERALARRRARPFLARPRGFLLAAALLLAALALWMLLPARGRQPQPSGIVQGPEADTRLIQDFDVLEEWDLLHQNDLDLLLSTLPATDQLLLEMGSEENAAAPEKTEKEAGRPSKG